MGGGGNGCFWPFGHPCRLRPGNPQPVHMAVCMGWDRYGLTRGQMSWHGPPSSALPAWVAGAPKWGACQGAHRVWQRVRRLSRTLVHLAWATFWAVGAGIQENRSAVPGVVPHKGARGDAPFEGAAPLPWLPHPPPHLTLFARAAARCARGMHGADPLLEHPRPAPLLHVVPRLPVLPAFHPAPCEGKLPARPPVFADGTEAA